MRLQSQTNHKSNVLTTTPAFLVMIQKLRTPCEIGPSNLRTLIKEGGSTYHISVKPYFARICPYQAWNAHLYMVLLHSMPIWGRAYLPCKRSIPAPNPLTYLTLKPLNPEIQKHVCYAVRREEQDPTLNPKTLRPEP